MGRPLPSLRRKGEAAVVTLTDFHLHQRRDFYCGPWDSPAARRRYAELLGQWEVAGRRWPCTAHADALTVAGLVQRYWRWAEPYYSRGESESIKVAWLVLIATHGDVAAQEFGPVKLVALREAMIAKKWTRPYINRQVQRVAAIWRWAAANELLPIGLFHGLKATMPLKRGKCTAPEPTPIKPVADPHVDAVEPFVSRQVWAIVQLQRLTGARAGELVKLRRLNLVGQGEIWRVDLGEDHKTAHFGKPRTITFGPLAQAILAPFLERPADDYLFSPREAEDQRLAEKTRARKTSPTCGNVATGRRRKDRGAHYTTASYRRAIARACKLAQIPVWHPHQIRHRTGTVISHKFGLVAAQLVLGHSSAKVTDAVYAERDHAAVAEVMRQIG